MKTSARYDWKTTPSRDDSFITEVVVLVPCGHTVCISAFFGCPEGMDWSNERINWSDRPAMMFPKKQKTHD